MGKGYVDNGLSQSVSFSDLTASFWRSMGWQEPFYYNASTRLMDLDIRSEYNVYNVKYEDYGLSQTYATITPLLFKPPYETRGWDMEKIWYINEGSETPRLVYRVPADLGEPLTHSMNYFYVVPHVQGTMNYMNLTWKSKGAFFSFPSPPAKGVLNQEVTYSIPDSDLTQTIVHKDDGTVDLVWFASGVRDVDGAGGFSGYNDQKRRTIVVGNQASATVNFYFTQPHMIPTVNYKVSISTPDGVVDVRAVSKEMSALKFCVDTNIQLGIALVEPNSDKTTKIRVAMPEGIKAFEIYTKYKDVEMEED